MALERPRILPLPPKLFIPVTLSLLIPCRCPGPYYGQTFSPLCGVASDNKGTGGSGASFYSFSFKFQSQIMRSLREKFFPSLYQKYPFSKAVLPFFLYDSRRCQTTTCRFPPLSPHVRCVPYRPPATLLPTIRPLQILSQRSPLLHRNQTATHNPATVRPGPTLKKRRPLDYNFLIEQLPPPITAPTLPLLPTLPPISASFLVSTSGLLKPPQTSCLVE